jgi:uncharacterized protein DUF6457
MENWIDDLARVLGEEPLTPAETTRLLDVARDVAHRVERKMTPLAAFMIGCAVGRDVASGAARAETLSGMLSRLEATLPPEASHPRNGIP